MGIRTGTYITSKISVDTEVTWRCSQCGKKNTAVQTMASEGVSSGPGYPSEKQKEEMKIKASKKAQVSLVGKLKDLADGKYHTANLTCGCESCGHREAWAQMDYRWAEKVRRVLLIWTALFALILVAFLLRGQTHAEGFSSIVVGFLVPVVGLVAEKVLLDRNR